jgi:uncharacterized protein YkwD
MFKPISAVFAALILVLAVAVVAAGSVAASQRTANEASMLQLIDHARAQRGLAPLHVQAALARAALAHSRDMMDRDYFSHASPGGASCAVRARRAGYATSGYRSWAVSEVIGWGRSSAGTPHAIFRSWMRSAYHRSIILGRRWRDVGVGCVSGTFQGASGSWMYTVDVGRRSH